MAGVVVVLEGAKLKGHKGLQSYSHSVGGASPCMGVVREFDAKKLKLRALQANQRVGQAVRSLAKRTSSIWTECGFFLSFFLDCGISKLQAGRFDKSDDQG